MNHCVIGSIISTTRAICNLFRAVYSVRYRFISIVICLVVFNAKRMSRIERKEKKKGKKRGVPLSETERLLDCFKITVVGRSSINRNVSIHPLNLSDISDETCEMAACSVYSFW